MQANESTPKPEQTFGEKRVRASFNPSRESAVDLLKGRNLSQLRQEGWRPDTAQAALIVRDWISSAA